MTAPRPLIRLDKWLWQARFFKTRSLSARLIAAGHVRVNGVKVGKPAQQVGPGDALTLVQGDQIRVVRVLAVGTRRGPAFEAQTLYDDMTPARDSVPNAPGFDGKGRPTKKDRRSLDLTRRPPLE